MPKIWPALKLLVAYLAFLDRRSEVIAVIAIVVTELEFGDIERHIFGAHLVECANDTALEDRPEALLPRGRTPFLRSRRAAARHGSRQRGEKNVQSQAQARHPGALRHGNANIINSPTGGPPPPPGRNEPPPT
jgi:hypothetical protein